MVFRGRKVQLLWWRSWRRPCRYLWHGNLSRYIDFSICIGPLEVRVWKAGQ